MRPGWRNASCQRGSRHRRRFPGDSPVCHRSSGRQWTGSGSAGAAFSCPVHGKPRRGHSRRTAPRAGASGRDRRIGRMPDPGGDGYDRDRYAGQRTPRPYGCARHLRRRGVRHQPGQAAYSLHRAARKRARQNAGHRPRQAQRCGLLHSLGFGRFAEVMPQMAGSCWSASRPCSGDWPWSRTRMIGFASLKPSSRNDCWNVTKPCLLKLVPGWGRSPWTIWMSFSSTAWARTFPVRAWTPILPDVHQVPTRQAGSRPHGSASCD